MKIPSFLSKISFQNKKLKKYKYFFREGFEFQTCGCERICNPGKEMSKPEACDHCKPVCVCPSGTFLHNGTCVAGTECSNMEEEQFTFKVKETLCKLKNINFFSLILM